MRGGECARHVCKQGKDASGVLTRARAIAVYDRFAQACATAAPALWLHSPLLRIANCRPHVCLGEPAERERNVKNGIIVENVDKWTMSTIVSRPFFLHEMPSSRERTLGVGPVGNHPL